MAKYYFNISQMDGRQNALAYDLSWSICKDQSDDKQKRRTNIEDNFCLNTDSLFSPTENVLKTMAGAGLELNLETINLF